MKIIVNNTSMKYGWFEVINWPDNVRIPVVGESIWSKHGQVRVSSVHWRVNDNNSEVQVEILVEE